MPSEQSPLLGRSIHHPQRDSLTVQVTRDLTARIDQGELKPGDQMPTERALMARYGVSRTVIREAVSSLRAFGRIATHQGRGAFVLDVPAGIRYRLGRSEEGTLQDVLKFMEVRSALESEAAALAAQRRTPEQLEQIRLALRQFENSADLPDKTASYDISFHFRITEASGNSYFTELFASFAPGLLPRSRLDLFKDDIQGKFEYMRRLHREHAQIFDAISRGDSEGARAAMRLHLTNSRERLRTALNDICDET